MTDATKRIWASTAVWDDELPLAGEWNYRQVSEPDDTEYLRSDLIDKDVLRRVEAALEDDVDAITHALDMLPDDCNQRRGMEGALSRSTAAISALRAMMDKINE